MSVAGRRLFIAGCMVVVLSIVASVAFAVRYHSLYMEERRLEAVRLQQANDMLALQGALGYGGLIHNFKNWVLRPGEVQYRNGALRSAENALAILADVGARMAREGIAGGVERQSETVRTYRDMIPVVGDMHARGATAREIDRVVRVPDDSALSELAVLEQQVRSLLDRDLDAAEETAALSLFCMLIAALGGMGLSFMLLRYWRQLRAEELSTAEILKARADDLESFSRIAAHDLRAPLRHIKMLAAFARDDFDREEVMKAELVRNLDDIESRARRLDSMIAGIFDYLATGNRLSTRRQTDVGAMLDDLSHMLVAPPATLVCETPMPRIAAQPVELELVLRNIISNAVKHHPDRAPNIVVRCIAQDRGHRFEIEDDGPGIPDTCLNRVFDLFWSAHGDTDGEEVSGMGLATVRRIVVNWGGEVDVRNAPGGGAIFGFSVPRYGAVVLDTERLAA